MKNSIPLLYIIGLLFISACNSNHKFDSSKWKEKKVDWEMSDFRENMLEDLITSKILIGMKLEGVINLLGQEIIELVNDWKDIGRHEIQWQGQDHLGRPVASGMYFSVLSDGHKTIVQKMLLLK